MNRSPWDYLSAEKTIRYWRRPLTVTVSFQYRGPVLEAASTHRGIATPDNLPARLRSRA